ncbi:MAG: S1C family serine protease [Candidatus Cyclobacteriaceae bacterium M2_1C_046]
MKQYILSFIIALGAGFGGSALYQQVNIAPVIPTIDSPVYVRQASYTPADEFKNTRIERSIPADAPEDFVEAARASTESVVFIRNITEKNYQRSYLEWLFGGGPNTQMQVSSGSGVIFTTDGYIITNNHVVDAASAVEVVHNKRTYPARVVGKDPNTDLAVLKIEGNNLPAISVGSSRTLNVGEWVLAVGNPFNLTSTVTAGIVSAKGREINILQSKFPIESFIQTDAAINPGNSGGALVNKEGKLVGINTAILSRTGSYTGYGFAVPVDMVRKIAGDIIKYGEVQKAFLGVEVSDLNQEIAGRLDLAPAEEWKGVVVTYLQDEGAADKGGLEEGDIILKINGQPVNTRSEFEEELSYRSPGDKINITYKEGGDVKTGTFTLTNREGTTGIVKSEVISSKLLGADMEKVSKVELDRLGLEEGVRVMNIKSGLINQMKLGEDFIIARINRVPVSDPEKLKEILENIKGQVIIEGLNSRGRYERHAFYFR